MSAIEEFSQAIQQAGLTPPDEIIADGEIHRFASNGDHDDDAGWYVFFSDGIAAGSFGCWRRDLKLKWYAKSVKHMTAAERTESKRRIAEAQRLRAEEETRMHAEAADFAQTLLQAAQPAPFDHPYLIRKQVQPHGLRVDHANNLIVPVRIDGQLASLQFIAPEPNSKKLFLRDGATKGGRFILGDLHECGPTILIAEGFATAASLFEATGYPTICAFSASNLLPVAQALRQQFPSATILLCGDNDVRTDETRNTGVEAATKAAQAIGGALAIPEAISNTKTDWNDIHTQLGLATVLERIHAALAHPVTILDEVFAFLGRFVSYPSVHAHEAHALWIAHTHLMDVWESTPRLAFLSPEPGSGKTRALEISEPLVPRPMQSINATEAALFRKVSDPDGRPTILYDESDTIFGPKAKEHEDIRALINAGHRRGALAHRCAVKGKQIVLEEFPAYCAVALAGLGNLPDTILARSIVVRMRRRAPSEFVESYRRRHHAPEGEQLREKLATWATQITPLLNLDPAMPVGVTDRDADVWESLLSIADAVGGKWPDRARVSAVTLVTDAMGDKGSLGVRLLTDLQIVFGERAAMATTEILQALVDLEESPWGDLRGKPLDARRLSRLLKPYEVSPKPIRIGSDVFKGYEAADLHDPWNRYLPKKIVSLLALPPLARVTTVTPDTEQAERVNVVTDEEVVIDAD